MRYERNRRDRPEFARRRELGLQARHRAKLARLNRTERRMGMAQRIEGPYDFSRYEFAQYVDGATWVLEQDVDYHVTGESVVRNARKWAGEAGLMVEARVLDDSGVPQRVALRFTPQTTDTCPGCPCGWNGPHLADAEARLSEDD